MVGNETTVSDVFDGSINPAPRIREVLELLRAYLEADGVDCEFVHYADGIATIRLKGSFSGCASILMTIKMGIEKRIMEELPEYVRAVEVV